MRKENEGEQKMKCPWMDGLGSESLPSALTMSLACGWFVNSELNHVESTCRRKYKMKIFISNKTAKKERMEISLTCKQSGNIPSFTTSMKYRTTSIYIQYVLFLRK